jgi:hypothetical protein
MIDCIGTVQISFRDLMEMRALTAHCSTLLLIWTGELISSSGRRVRASSSTSGPRHAAPVQYWILHRLIHDVIAATIRYLRLWSWRTITKKWFLSSWRWKRRCQWSANFWSHGTESICFFLHLLSITPWKQSMHFGVHRQQLAAAFPHLKRFTSSLHQPLSL